MNIQGLANLIRSNAKRNAPAYLTAGACVGVVATAYFAIKNTWKAKDIYDEWAENNGIPDSKRERVTECTKLLARTYVPTICVGLGTIGCSVAAYRYNKNQTLAAIASGAIIQRAYDEYRGQVREVWGEKKDQEIVGKIAEEKVKDNPPPAIITGSGHVLCCELYTGRYFMSDVESLRKAQNTLNQKLLAHDFATLADFQYMIGLTPTSHSVDIGWTSSRLMELEISAILTSDDKPCLAFDYNYTVPV